jgi:hypothetical protein
MPYCRLTDEVQCTFLPARLPKQASVHLVLWGPLLLNFPDTKPQAQALPVRCKHIVAFLLEGCPNC